MEKSSFLQGYIQRGLQQGREEGVSNWKSGCYTMMTCSYQAPPSF